MILNVSCARTFNLLNIGHKFIANINSDAIVMVTQHEENKQLDNGREAWHIFGGNNGCLLDVWIDDIQHEVMMDDWCRPSKVKIEEVVVTK
jgi:hypothetical protein